MRDKPAILVGLVVFLALATFPGWYTVGTAALFSADTSPPYLAPASGALKFSTAWSRGAPGLAGLRDQFERHGLAALSDNARLIADADAEVGKWRIYDGDRRYLVLTDQDQGTLAVYDGCVEDVEEMRANHMSLLIEWRDGVIRHGDTSTVAVNGQAFAKSLTKTCLGCHTDRQTFCYPCHQYVNTLPAWPARNISSDQEGIRCWNCHLQPEEEVNDD